MAAMTGKKRWILLGAAAVLLALLIWMLWGNFALQTNTHYVVSARLPAAFDGFRIAQISDLHNCKNPDPLPQLKACAPDIIVLTGDLIDSRHTDVEAALSFVREAVKIAPCYFVTGNHEARSPDWDTLEQGLLQAGVTVLCNETVTLTRNGQSICLLGLTDAGFQGGIMASIPADPACFTVALAHRPEYIDTYVAGGYDLVFVGHAHGGQFRLPFAGGVIAPGQGLFPKYDGGVYQEGATQMLVSRGIGNSVVPLRINNRPEILLAILQTETE